MIKICISGSVCAGKSYFVDNFANILGLQQIPETARKLSEEKPHLTHNLEVFRQEIAKKHIEQEISLQSSALIDRGFFDNLAFLLLSKDPLYNYFLEETKNIYKNPNYRYSLIVYFDLSERKGITPLLEQALQDPLRKKTIDTAEFFKFNTEFKRAFECIIKEFKTEVLTICTIPDIQEYNKRNTLLLQMIKKYLKK